MVYNTYVSALVLQLSAYGRVGYSIRARGNTYFRGGAATTPRAASFGRPG